MRSNDGIGSVSNRSKSNGIEIFSVQFDLNILKKSARFENVAIPKIDWS
jgi:hypothetical protein